MGLLNKKNIKNIASSPNKFGVKKEDLIGELEGLPMAVFIRALENREEQRGEIKKTDIEDAQNMGIIGMFTWDMSEEGYKFWSKIDYGNFDEFYKKYPGYRKYDRS